MAKPPPHGSPLPVPHLGSLCPCPLLLSPLPLLPTPSPLHVPLPLGKHPLFRVGSCFIVATCHSPLPMLLLSLPLRPLLLWVGWVCQLWCAGNWPLGGLCPGSGLTMLANIRSACSLGVLLPPNGGGALSPTPVVGGLLRFEKNLF